MNAIGDTNRDVRVTRTVLVLGAGGFLGGYIVAALRRAGWRVLRGVRPKGQALREDERDCDVATMLSPDRWTPVLEGVDAVVNVAGILRETRRQRFEPIHRQGPLALARACVAVGVQQFVQISALGQESDGEFVASKHRFDHDLMQLPLSAIVFRPSVVYSTSGSYGGTSLLRALAAVPAILPLPGDGRWRIQPLAAEDLAELVVRALQSPASGVFDVGGPAPISLREYQQGWRRWLGLSAGTTMRTPEWLVSLVVWLGERIGRGPMGESTWRMLRRGNVTAPDAGDRLQTQFGCVPRVLDDVLAAHPSQVQDRWQAQLYFVSPALRFGMVVLFLLSAWVGLVTPAADIERMTTGSLLAALEPVAIARAAAVLDLVLGACLLVGWRTRGVILAMFALVFVYTLVFGSLLPELWLDPLGGLAKNLVVLPALAVLWVTAERR